MSKNADGWIRHRGGKCPVAAGTEVSTRHRDGKIVEVHHMTAFEGASAESLKCVWSHKNDDNDIMAYRLHKPAEQVEPFLEVVQAFHALEKFPQLDGPLQWRDRITEIDATTQALTTERANLVQKLAGEGFALIGREVELVEDMSDWRNWKKGDLIEMVNQKPWADMTDGKTYSLTKAGSQGFSFVDDIGDMREAFASIANDYAKDFKWHSRPST